MRCLKILRVASFYRPVKHEGCSVFQRSQLENLYFCLLLLPELARSKTKQQSKEPDVLESSVLNEVLEDLIFSTGESKPLDDFMSEIFKKVSANFDHGTLEYARLIEKLYCIFSNIVNVTIGEMACSVGCYQLLLLDELILTGYRPQSDVLCTLSLLHSLKNTPPESRISETLTGLAQLSCDRGLPGLGQMLIDQSKCLGNEDIDEDHCTCKLLFELTLGN